MSTRRLDALESDRSWLLFLCEGVVLRSVIVANDGVVRNVSGWVEGETKANGWWKRRIKSRSRPRACSFVDGRGTAWSGRSNARLG